MTRRLPFLFMNVGHFLDHYFLLIFPTAVVVLEAEGAGRYGDLLLPGTLAYVAFAAGTLPAGWLGDRLSRSTLMAAMFCGLGLSSLLAGLSGGGVWFLAGLTGIGLFAAIYHPVGIAMVADGAAGGTGRALGVNGIWGNMGVAAAPLTTGLLASTWGWQSAFVVPGVVSLVVGLAYLALVPAVPPRRKAAAGQAEESYDRSDQRRVFAYLAASAVAGGIVFSVTTVVLPKLMEEKLADAAVGVVGAAGVATLIFAAAAFAQAFTGAAVDRVAPRRLVWRLSLAQIPFLLLLTMAAGWASVPLALALMLAVFGIIPIQDTLVARYTPQAWRARVYALKSFAGLGVSATAIPLIAWLHEPGGGFSMLLVALAVCAGAFAAAALILPGHRPAAAVVRAAAE